MTDQILRVFEQFRMAPIPADMYHQQGRALLGAKMEEQISKGQQLTFVMLGFPFKSTNIKDKVLGVKPDMAELETFKQFARFGAKMKEVYSAGVQVKVVSDGYVFNDLLEVDDRTVAQYKELCEDMIYQTEAPVQIIELNDLYSTKNLAVNREKVMSQFGITETQLRHNILFDTDVNILYRGMIQFMGYELAMKEYRSNNQLHKAAKRLANDMMFRNEAYSNLVKHEFKSDIRLSMHPSVNNGAKYSFQLINSENAHHSAWHSVLVMDMRSGTVETMHKRTALENNYQLINVDGQAFHFIKQ